MTHEIQPSRFGKGTTYDNNGKHIIPPAGYEIVDDTATVDRPRIARVSGVIAVENSGIGHMTVKQELRAGSYASPNERQQALDIAEINNIMSAAKKAGMTVDQWKSRRSRSR